MYFVDHLLSKQDSYQQCVSLGNGVYLPGPRKIYDLSVEEKKVLAASGVSTASQYAWSFKHCIVQGVCNCICIEYKASYSHIMYFSGEVRHST